MLEEPRGMTHATGGSSGRGEGMATRHRELHVLKQRGMKEHATTGREEEGWGQGLGRQAGKLLFRAPG